MLRPRHARTCFAPNRFIESLENRALLSAGQFDPSFGKNGTATVDFHGPSVQSEAVATQNDGKTVIVGNAATFDSHGNLQKRSVAVVRLNLNGTPDTTFGPNHNGIVLTHLGDSSQNAFNDGEAVVIDPNGNIDVAVTYGDNDPSAAVVRYTPNGSLDKSFDGDGIATIDDGFANGLALQSNGKIVVVGDTPIGVSHSNMLVARLNSSGSQDGSFNGGEVNIDFSDDGSFARAVQIDSSGNIFVAGDSQLFLDNGAASSRFALAQLKSNGDVSRQVTFAPPHSSRATATSLRLESDGSILVAGYSGTAPPSGFDTGDIFTVAHVKANFGLDKTFANGHTWATVGFGGNDEANSLVIGQDNRLLVSGSVGNKIGVAAFMPDGTLDASFGTLGRVTIDYGGKTPPFGTMAYGPGHRFVVTGGGKFNTSRIFDNGANLVHAQSIDPTASEVGPKVSGFFVFREERLPVATRVFFTVGGTAVAPTLITTRFHSNDYTLDGMSSTIGQIGSPTNIFFTDIPANQTFASVVLTPIDRKLGDGDKTATFNIVQNASYDIGNPSNVKITIKDKANPNAPVADAYVRDGSSANTNFGSAADLEAKTGNTGFNRRSYLKFDLTGINSVNTVLLTLHGGPSSSTPSGIMTSVFGVADTSWTESGITFNNAPAAGATAIASKNIILDDAYTFDVTSYFKSQLAAGHHIISLMVKNVSTSSAVVTFASREAASGAPFLFIV